MRRPGGYVLIITILVIGMLFFLAITYVNLFRAEKALAQQGREDIIAEAAADAGIDDAIASLKANASWESGFDNVQLSHSGARYNVSFSKTQTAIPFSTHNGSGASGVAGYGGRIIPAGMIHLISVGEYQGARRIEECLLSTTGGPLFRGAAYVKENITFTGNAATDGYDSSKGPYSELNHDHTTGDVGTNSGAAGVVSISGGNAVIGGTLTVGPGGSEGSSVNPSGAASYSGFNVLTEAMNLAAISPSQSSSNGDQKISGKASLTLSPGTYGSLAASGGTVILQPGTYIFTGDFSISGQAVVQTPSSGQVLIYVLGSSIDITGQGLSNQTGRPKNLVMYGGADTTSVKISGGGSLIWGLFAPAADIRITGGGEVYGAMVGRTLTLTGNGVFHYDRDIMNVTGGPGGMTVKARW